MEVYRIAPCKFLHDLSGWGAATYGGRWNSKNTYVVYTAHNRALALLETLVHIGKIPETGFCIATIFIPDDSIDVCQVENLPIHWAESPPPDVLKTVGDSFVRSNQFLALKIPSVIMPEDFNILLNPAHKDFNRVKIIADRPLRVDERLFPIAKA